MRPKASSLEMNSNLQPTFFAREPFDALALSPTFSFDHSAQLPALHTPIGQSRALPQVV
jgi:hypothetical protein